MSFLKSYICLFAPYMGISAKLVCQLFSFKFFGSVEGANIRKNCDILGVTIGVVIPGNTYFLVVRSYGKC